MDIFTQLFGELKDYKEPTLLPSTTLAFSTFLNDIDIDGNYNLYIIRHPNCVLYVGISTNNIWNRWFHMPDSHMRFVQKYSGTLEGGKWIGSSPIGMAIQKNFPSSLQWTIELQQHQLQNLREREQELIHQLRPLFNTTYRPSFTEEDIKLLQEIQNGL